MSSGAAGDRPPRGSLTLGQGRGAGGRLAGLEANF